MALLWAAPGWATDLRLALGAQGEYDSNVYRREEKIRDDFVILGIPSLELLETEGKFTYDVGYEFPYQRSIKTNALRSFNHLARIGADYHLSDRTQFSFSNRFSYVEALSNNNENDTPTIADNETDQEVLRNRATFHTEHRFTPRLANDTNFTQAVYYTTQDNRSDNQSYGLATGLHYDLTERQTLGGGVQTTYQNFENAYDLFTSSCGGIQPPTTVVREQIPESQTIFVGPYAAWSYRIDEQSQFRISGGPTYVHSEQDSFFDGCNQQRSDSDDRIAFLGQFSVDRRWSPTMASGFSYQRHQDTASGVAGSAILDAVALTHTWMPAERWTLALRGDWTQRKSATNINQSIRNEDLDTQRWGAGAMLAYKITRNLTGSVRYQYSKQRSEGNTAGRFSDFDGHVAALGLNYALDPIEVW
jgi:opacity protein-like surface antigen